MNKKEIIDILKDGSYTPGVYELLKQCLKTDNRIDAWFEGLVGSLKYNHPNTRLLVLCGKAASTSFFEFLLPSELERFYKSALVSDDDVKYERFIVDIAMREGVFKLIKTHDFSCGVDRVSKRVCSYCTTWTSKWIWPQKKNVIVIHIESIDWELFYSINKLDLWKEIFYMF